MDHSLWQGGTGLSQGHAGGVGPCDPAEQVLETVRTADPLQVSDQGKGTIRLVAPPQTLATFKDDLESHGPGLATERTQDPSSRRFQTQACERFSQTINVPEDSWQDGEMGQDENAR